MFVIVEIQDCELRECVRAWVVDPVHESGVTVPVARHARIVIFILGVDAFQTSLAVRGLLFILFGSPPVCRRAVFCI